MYIATYTLPCCCPAPEMPFTREKSKPLACIRVRMRSNASIHMATGA